MQESALLKLVSETKLLKSEKQNIELKSCKGGFPKIYDTLSSFSNQDEGGIIIFGISDKPDYEIIGVYDAQDVQKKINEACKQMEPVIRAVVTICEIDGKKIVSAEIPGADISKRPVFYAGAGRVKGSYVRVGDSDEHMNEYEIYNFEAFRKRIKDDERIVSRAKLDLFDKSRLQNYLEAVKFEKKNLSENLSDNEILELMGVTIDNKPTLAGVMVFSTYPQAYFPQLCITAVVIPGTEMGDTGENGERFIDNKRITGSISEMLEGAVEFVRKNSRTKTIIGSDGQRYDRIEYPIIAVREAILNALVHRDYSIYTENTPISIEMYRDRMEIKSSGGLYGYISLQMLGKVRPDTRNPILANILENLKVTENRYSGIPTILKEFKNAGLPEPEFDIKRGEFIVKFKNDIFVQERPANRKNMKAAVLKYCELPRSRKEIIDFTGFSKYYTMHKIVEPLINEGLLKLTIPDKPKSSKQQYVKTT